jgi:hypothetical protein
MYNKYTGNAWFFLRRGFIARPTPNVIALYDFCALQYITREISGMAHFLVLDKFANISDKFVNPGDTPGFLFPSRLTLGKSKYT